MSDRRQARYGIETGGKRRRDGDALGADTPDDVTMRGSAAIDAR